MAISRNALRLKRSSSRGSRSRGVFGRGGRWARFSLVAALTGGTMIAPLAASSTPVSAAGISCTGDDIAMTTYYGVSLFNTTNPKLTPFISSSVDPKAAPGTIQIEGLTAANQVGLVDLGNKMVLTGDYQPDGKPYVWTVDLNTGASVKQPILERKVAGGINLVDGKFYYGGYYESSAPDTNPVGTGLEARISSYDSSNNTILNEQGIVVWLPGAPGGNGDFMFDKDGNLFLVSSSQATGEWRIYVVNGPLPAPVAGEQTRLTAIQFSAGFVEKDAVLNGLAFGNDGYVYASGNKAIRQLTTNGEIVKSFTGVTGTETGTDMASCVDPARLSLYKDLPSGRAKITDQFGLSVTGPTIDAGNSAITMGTEPGLQKEINTELGIREFVGPVLARGGDVVTLTETAESGTNLADYTTTLTCTDKTTGNPVTVTGTGTSRQITMPASGFGAPAPNVECIYVNDAAPTITVEKNLPKGRLKDTDQFTVAVTPGDASATTAGTATGVQPETAVLDPAAYDTTYTIAETAAGTTNLDYYETTWSCIDTASNNANVGSGTGSSGTISMKLGTVSPQVKCTFTNTPKPPQLVPTKSVDPASGTAVVPGQKLVYSVNFTNKGGSPATVDYVDDISGVLDDATLTMQPKVGSGSALQVSGVNAGKFTMKGELAPGASSTVTYEVVVKPDGQRGDNILENFVILPDTPTPETCLDTNDLCTENPVPELVMKKDVDPEDGSTVLAGQVLTYTMTFDNSKGESEAPVDMVDNLADVLDDATVVEDPKLATGSGLTVSKISNGEFTISGKVGAGQVATVTYKVQVKADADRGNSILENFLLPPGNPPPEGGCPPGDPMCTSNPVPGLGIVKDVVPEDGSTVVVGQELTYTLTLTNTGAAAAVVDKVDDMSGVLDDATLTEEPKLATGTGLTVSPVDKTTGKFTIKGEIQPGATATITMKVVVNDKDNRGDDVLLNFVLNPGTETPEICNPGDPLCTENPVSNLEIVKTVDPESGSVVVAGQELTYTLTFSNDGAAAATVDKVDNLAGLLDDADVTVDPVLATGSGLVVSAIEDSEFSITGEVAAGATATVTMKVVVKADDDRGDSKVLNFVIEKGTTPPPICVPPDKMCTENLVPGPGIAKSVDPEDGSTVIAGQELTYTLTFTNTGAADAVFDTYDNMAGVLDDADIVEEPKLATGEGLEVGKIDADGKFTIKGKVAPGATATVTMKVVVKADGERGDDDLLNFVGPGDVCVAGDPLCTENPVSAPAIDLVKAIETVDDVDANGSNTLGDVIRYKFTVTNTGNVVLKDIKLNDPLISNEPLACPKTTLEVEESMVCLGATHTITAADVAELSVRNTATVTGVDPDGREVTDTDSQIVPVVSIAPPQTSTTLKPGNPRTGSGSARSASIAALLSLALGASLLAASRTRRQHA